MDTVFGFGVFFTFVYLTLKMILDHILRNKLINRGQMEQVRILQPVESREVNFYPSLKWGLVLFFGGIGLMCTEYIKTFYPSIDFDRSPLIYGTILTSASLGFLIYFIIVAIKNGNKG